MFRKFLVLVLCICSTSLWSQFDPYKYIVVPVQFEGFKQPNMHKTSTLVKFFLEQRGLPAVYDLGKPQEVDESPCIAAYTQFIDDSNMIATRVILRFVDCKGRIVFETVQGMSKEKEYKVAYKEAIEQVFYSFDGVHYSYKPPAKATAAAAEGTLVAENTPPEQEVAAGQEAQDQASPAGQEAQDQANPAGQEALDQPGDIQDMGASKPSETMAAMEVLYAQPIEGGYQLVDSSPAIKMLLMESNRGEGVYMAVIDGNSAGTVYRDGDAWIHEYFEGGKVVRTPLNIKF